MDFINLKSLNLTAEESEDLIKFLAQKRGITTKKLLSTIKLNLKRKNNKDLASKSQQKLIKSIKTQQILTKTQLELIKTQQKLIKSIKKQQNLAKQAKSRKELIKLQRKLRKQQTLSNTKKIRNSFYNIDKKIKNTNDDFIDNIRDLFNTNVDKKINNTFFISFNEYLELIKPYLYDLINVYKAKGEWKLQLSAEISFVSQKPDSNEIRIMCTRSTPEEIITGCQTEEVAEKLIMQLLQKYQDNLQNKMKGSDFIFNGINYLYYDLNRITISKGGSYIESPKWLKDKKCTINQKNTDNKCFQYATTLALNFDNINKDPQRI